MSYLDQDELRTNIKTALADRGLRHRDLAEVLDLPVTHVSNRLHSQWWSRDEVQAVADFLDMDFDELLGDSLFKGDPEIRRRQQARRDAWRAANEAEREAEAERRKRSKRGLCCVCGALNLVDVDAMSDAYLNASTRQALKGRWVGTHPCVQCGENTRHALLKDGTKRDVFEEHLHKKTAEQEAREKVDALVTRLVGFNIDVHYRSIGRRKYRMKKGIPIGAVEYDASKSQWRVEINHQVPAIAQLPVLEEIWRAISTDDQEWWSDIEGGPEAGAWVFRGDAGSPWDDVADALIDEISHALDVEHTKLVLDVRDEISEQEVDQ